MGHHEVYCFNYKKLGHFVKDYKKVGDNLVQGEFTMKQNVVKWYGCKWDHMNCIYVLLGLFLEKCFLELFYKNLQKKSIFKKI
jgi:hypothetical protein